MGCETAFGRSPLFVEAIVKVWVYVDGFNLYNGALRNTPYKWLDLLKFSRSLLPSDQIDHIKYFTALVDSRVNDPDQPYRQMTYWRALQTLGCVDIIKGRFLTKKTWMPEAASVENLKTLAASGVNVFGVKPNMLEVLRSEEKGTDVNLAAHLIHDAHLNRFEAALIVSNDSDVAESVRIVRNEIGKVVGVCTPHRNRPSVELKNTASFFREIKRAHIRSNQFADILTDGSGTFSKPSSW